jgi:alkylation response protein AidB-like acyl-CoA dehydrogenase
MYVGMSKEQEALRDELRAYYDELLTPDVVADIQKGEGVGQKSKDVWKKMAADGYAGVGWPKEWGGRGLTPIEQFVFFDESMRSGAPVPMLTINSVAPTIMRYGSEEQKQFYVPKILAGEIHFAIGYTEPDAGTDLAALQTRAVRDGDEYVINGQKVFTSLASGADYIWLAVRTNPEVKKHKGISIIIVPTDTPGFRYVPIDNFGATNTNITYYEDVRVPVGNLVGEENGGWGLITNQLNHERVTLCSSGVVERMLDDTRAWAQETKLADGRRVIDQEWVQVNLARVHAKLEFLRLANWRVAWLAQSGAALNPADASTIKVYGTEFYMEAARLLMEVMRDQATLQGDSPGAVLAGRVERMLRSMHILTFGGGTNEMQRDLIAIFGLNMPGSPR